MNWQKTIRWVHHWASPILMLPFGVVIVTGLLLQVKKDSSWVQPPAARGSAPGAVPDISLGEVFVTLRGIESLEVDAWSDLARVDIKPDKGILKAISHNGWEAQLDSATGEVLRVSLRRSDVIESLHDGSFFSQAVKRSVFLPSGVLVFVMWLSGVYLFFLPRWKKAKKRRKQR